MTSSNGPRRTRRPRTACPSSLKGWMRSSSGTGFSCGPRCPLVPGAVIASADSEAPSEDAFLRMQAVLGLVPDDRLRAVDNRGRHLLAAMGRQTMQKDRARFRHGHDALVDPIAGEQVVVQ